MVFLQFSVPSDPVCQIRSPVFLAFSPQDEMTLRIYTKKRQNAIIKFKLFCQHIRRKHSTMTRNKIKFSHTKWLLPLWILLIGSIVLYMIAHAVQQDDFRHIRTLAELNAVTYGDNMIADLYAGISITDTLEQLLISTDGRIDKFDTIADRMMADYVQSIQLAPGGVVTDIYSTEGNEAGKIDLIHDKDRGEIVNYGIDHDLLVIHGPFELKQGGYGIAIRNPVFLQDENGNSYFWGLTIVIIKATEIFRDSVDSLSGFGYQYRLSKTLSPLTDEYAVVDQSEETLMDPVSYDFTLGGCSWKLEVMPTGGWKNDTLLRLIVFCDVTIILLLEVLTISILLVDEQRKKFRRLSLTDSMTGLLNRTGFNSQLEEYLEGNKQKNCVGILLDVDNFKFINDVYGHTIGDQVLLQLSQSLVQAFPDNSIIARNGGDEFCIILKDCSAEEAAPMIDAFSKASRSFSAKGVEHNYSISLGYTEYPANAEKVSDILRYADIALYEVKLQGKHGALAYRPDFHNSKRTQLGFSLSDISDNLPGAFFIYRAEKEDERILYANQEMLQLTGCKDLDDFMHFTKHQFRNLVHPEDLTQVEESIWQQIESGMNGYNDYVKYRLAVKDGTYKTVLDYGRIVESEHYGSVFYVLVVDCEFIKTHYDD